MFGYISGKIITSDSACVIVDTGGVGYKVFVPANLKPETGKKISLFVHTKVSENGISLYGLRSPEELKLFESIVSVSGVGPKIALSIVSAATGTQIKAAIAAGNVEFFVAIPGIGKKGAQKIIVELKSRLGKGELDLASLGEENELVLALLSLGFKRAEIRAILTKIDTSLGLAAQVKAALKLLK